MALPTYSPEQPLATAVATFCCSACSPLLWILRLILHPVLFLPLHFLRGVFLSPTGRQLARSWIAVWNRRFCCNLHFLCLHCCLPLQPCHALVCWWHCIALQDYSFRHTLLWALCQHCQKTIRKYVRVWRLESWLPFVWQQPQ